jgi:hypothetical protein
MLLWENEGHHGVNLSAINLDSISFFNNSEKLKTITLNEPKN